MGQGMLFNVKDLKYYYSLTQQDIADAFSVRQGLISTYAKLGDDFQVEVEVNDEGVASIISWVRVARGDGGEERIHTKKALKYE